MAKRQERIEARRKKILRYFEKNNAVSVQSGKTVREISRGVGEAESVVRVDLEALRAEAVERDTKRVPTLYWKER